MPEPDPSLLAAYHQTSYCARTPRGHITIRINESHPALDELLAAYRKLSWCFITAWNPGSQPRPEAANLAAQRELLADLSERDVIVFAGESVADDGGWEPEPSALVLGLDQAAGIQLGRRFGQIAIVVGAAGEPARLALCGA
ncbi:MAG TPA: DUF3293 domain-containing protein [candidate division Zixibacteria bacterium]|nr:DUF3293 domain-containing protein [candidate division Zixibacteria bacterium]